MGSWGSRPPRLRSCPKAVAVMDPFHVVRLAGDALDRCRRRVQQELHGHRGRARDPLYRSRGLCTRVRICSPTDRSTGSPRCSATEDHVEVEATWGVYQRHDPGLPSPEQDPWAGADGRADRRPSAAASQSCAHRGRHPRSNVEEAPRRRARLLRTPRHPSNGPTEAINGRLEHLRGTALGFRNLTNYIARSLLEAGGFRPVLHPAL